MLAGLFLPFSKPLLQPGTLWCSRHTYACRSLANKTPKNRSSLCHLLKQATVYSFTHSSTWLKVILVGFPCAYPPCDIIRSAVYVMTSHMWGSSTSGFYVMTCNDALRKKTLRCPAVHANKLKEYVPKLHNSSPSPTQMCTSSSKQVMKTC